MTSTHKFEAWITFVAAVLVTTGILAAVWWQRQQPILLRGAVLVQDADPRKQQPIPGVIISAGDLATSDAKSDASGYFVLKLRKTIRRKHAVSLSFRNPQYRPLVLNDTVSSKLYIAHLIPVANTPPPRNQPDIKVANVRVRYTVKAMTELNVGSAIKTFEIKNQGNLACKGQRICSPDGKWKASVASTTLDAGPGNLFRNARASCIAGPCPFTRIDADQFSQGGQIITLTARDWSDTATFLLEAEVFHPMVSQMERWSYPVIFGDALSFSLPATAESVSIEAELGGQSIIFPLGPSLLLSWATCDVAVNPDTGRIYRCTARPGYRFH